FSVTPFADLIPSANGGSEITARSTRRSIDLFTSSCLDSTNSAICLLVIVGSLFMIMLCMLFLSANRLTRWYFFRHGASQGFDIPPAMLYQDKPVKHYCCQ